MPPPHPIHPTDDRCAVVERANRVGQWGANCERPPTRRGVWRFVDRDARIVLCDLHAAELVGDDRLTLGGPIG